MARLVEATRADQVAVVRELFAEYARMVDEPCCFVDFERELDRCPATTACSSPIPPRAASRCAFSTRARRR